VNEQFSSEFPSESESAKEPDVAESVPDTDALPGPDESPSTTDPQADSDGEAGVGAAPETGDLVIDAALRELADAPAADLDAQIELGEQVQRTLQGRLSDLGG